MNRNRVPSSFSPEQPDAAREGSPFLATLQLKRADCLLAKSVRVCEVNYLVQIGHLGGKRVFSGIGGFSGFRN
jgi:hypothetical protein